MEDAEDRKHRERNALLLRAYNTNSGEEDHDAYSDGKGSNDSFAKDYNIPNKLLEIEK